MSRRKFNIINLAVSFLVALGILGTIVSIGATNSFAQSELTAVSTQDQEGNATAAAALLGNPFFVEQGRITGQRVLAVAPQPELEFSFMANASINNAGGFVINAIIR